MRGNVWTSLAAMGCAAALAVAGFLGACNSGTADCPAASAVTPGGACDHDNVQCAYTLATPSPACDGTSTTIATSCVCTSGTWSCPAPVSCEAGTDDGGEDGETDDGATEDGETADADDGGATDDGATDDGATTDGATDDGATDAPSDAPVDAPKG